MYGSRGPFFDATTASSEPITTLPAAKPQDQKQVPRYYPRDPEDRWEFEEADYKEKLKWAKEEQKFKQKEQQHELKLQQLPYHSKSKGGAPDPFAQQEAEYKENLKWEKEKQKWAQKQQEHEFMLMQEKAKREMKMQQE